MKFRRHISLLFLAITGLCFVCMNTTTVAEPNYFGANHVIPPARSFSSVNCYRSVPNCIPFRASSNAFQCLDVNLPYRQTFPPVSISASPAHHSSQAASTASATTSNNGNNNSNSSSEQIAANTPTANFDSTSKAINEYLTRWNGLRAIPQCWKALQYVLCSSFFPKCEDDNGSPKIFLPTYDMCRAIRSPCRLVEQHFRWPEWLHCENQSLFSQKSSHCFNEYKEMRLSTTATGEHLFRCHPPLVNTDDKSLWYPGIDGCAVPCQPSALYGEADSRLVRTAINYASVIGLLIAATGLSTFYIDRSRTTRYPSRCIFYVNLAVFLSYLSWTIQHLLRQTEFTCRPDNTARHGKGNATCIASFALIYYFSMAAMLWLVIFAYGCAVVYRPKTTSSRKPSEKLYENKNIFHFVAWFVPFIFTLIIIWMEEIDGDSLFGICFVGFAKPYYFSVFVIIPITLNLVLYIIFMAKAANGLWTCFNITANKLNDAKQQKKQRKIYCFMLRIFVSVTGSIFLYLVFVFVYFYQQSLTETYNFKLNQHIICSFNITDALEPKQSDLKTAFSSNSEVRIHEITETEQSEDYNSFQVDHCAKLKPVVELWPIVLQIICNFSTCILAFLWICNESALKSWIGFFRQKFDRHCYNETMRCLKKGTSKTAGNQSQIDASNYRKPKPDSFLLNPVNGHHNGSSCYFDPVEMEFSSIQGSIYCTNYTLKATSEKHCRIVGGNSVTITGDNQSLSECYNNSITQLSRSLDSVSLVESIKGNRRGKRKPKKQLGRLLNRRSSDTSDLSVASVATLGASYLAKQKSRPLESPFQQKLAQLRKLQELQLASADVPVAPVAAATTINDILLATSALRRSMTPALGVANLANLVPQQQQQLPLPPPLSICPPNPYLSPYFTAPLSTMPPSMAYPAPQFVQQQNLQASTANIAQPQQQHQQPIRGQFSHNVTSFQGSNFESMPSTAVRPPGSFLSFHQQAQPFQFATPGSFAQAPVAFQPMAPPPAIRRPSALRQTSFTFTHGYSVSDSQLVNPMEVKRRPDSRTATDTVNHILELNNNCVVQTAADNNHHINVQMQPSMTMHDYIDWLIKQLEQQITKSHIAKYKSLNCPWIINGENYNPILASEFIEQLQQKEMSASEYEELIKERELYKEIITNRGDSRASDFVMPTCSNSNSEISILSALTRLSINSESKFKERLKLDKHMQKISGENEEPKKALKAKTKLKKEKHEKAKKDKKSKKNLQKFNEQTKKSKNSVNEDSDN